VGTIFDRNENNTVESLLNISIDITHEHSLRTQLEEEKAFAEMLLDNCPEMIMVYDTDMHVRAWNKKSEEHNKIKKEEIIGKQWFDFFPQYNNDKWINELKQSFSGKTLYYPKIEFLNKEGYGEAFVIPLQNAAKEVTGVLSITRDITEIVAATDRLEKLNTELQESNLKLQEAREELAMSRTRSLIEALPHIVITANSKGEFDYSNQHLMNFTGLSFHEVKKGKWIDLIHEDETDEFLKVWDRSLAEKLNLNMEFRLKRADGEYLWHLAIAELLTKGGSVSEDVWIITLTNIHNQKLIDEKKDEFIGIASHELKTPLTSVKGYVQIVQTLLAKENHSTALKYIQKANQFIDRLHSLISELLDITKIHHGKLLLKQSEFNFNQILTETIEIINPSSSNHTIEVVGQIDNIVVGDKERIQQVLINLLSNAIKYSPNANKVEVYLQNFPDHLHISVKDYGIGIPRPDQKKIFDKFYRVEDNSKQFQGLGIGLFIAAEIIRRHKGEIWVEGEPGKGSTFHFTLPQILK
jgi:PAS domain S-box-containing protein